MIKPYPANVENRVTC